MMPPLVDSSDEEDGTGEKAEKAISHEPDKWILIKHGLLRQHNTPRKHLFTPNEVDDDPSPIPTVL